MAENCAGCGHSHDLSGGRFGPTLACWEPPFGSCKCPGYRTRGQLDALARIEELEKVVAAGKALLFQSELKEDAAAYEAWYEVCVPEWEDLRDALAALGGEHG